ncbi:MAG: glycosyltransferase [Desulfomonile tiedjei]|uniref:Glycosyltransferase n=1 Tax=Desulfomonile tiedjei TaxID=2358 RepID=A0A9D6V2F1_9BACT|nr:glycosyltransferase [Desulfomonile tiedjei]
MRVLHLVYALYRGGLESWLLRMLREIPRDVAAMDVCCMGVDTGPWAEQASDLGARVLHCPLRPDHIGFYLGLRRILNRYNYDLIHNHLGVYSGFPVWIAKRERVPVITTFHNTDFSMASLRWLRLPLISDLRRLYARLSIDYAARNTNILSGVSKGVLNDIIAGRNGLQVKSRVLYLGVPLPEIPTQDEKAVFRKSLGFEALSPLIIHVGRFIEQKNHYGVIEIFKRVLRVCPDARLLLIGEGPLRSRVEDAVERDNLSEYIMFLGFRDDASTLIAKCDLFLLPSLHEGLPVVALEAQAAAVPLVGSMIPGLTEAVEQGRTAVLHPVEDLQGMADSALKILTDCEFATQLGTAGRGRIQKAFSVKAAAGRLLEIYEELINRSERTTA